jgi:hypothetical protein
MAGYGPSPKPRLPAAASGYQGAAVEMFTVGCNATISQRRLQDRFDRRPLPREAMPPRIGDRPPHRQCCGYGGPRTMRLPRLGRP